MARLERILAASRAGGQTCALLFLSVKKGLANSNEIICIRLRSTAFCASGFNPRGGQLCRTSSSCGNRSAALGLGTRCLERPDRGWLCPLPSRISGGSKFIVNEPFRGRATARAGCQTRAWRDRLSRRHQHRRLSQQRRRSYRSITRRRAADHLQQRRRAVLGSKARKQLSKRVARSFN